MKGLFKRVSPAAFADKVGIINGWFVISSRWMPDVKERRLFHGRYFKIKSDKGTVYRILRFSPQLKSKDSEPGEIVIDWVGWLDLWGREEAVDGEIELKFSKVRWWEFPFYAASHPDPAMRISALLGIWSVVLGIIGVCLGALSLHH